MGWLRPLDPRKRKEIMISLHIDGAVATATLCRPPVNAINDEWLDRLEEVLDRVEAYGGMQVAGVLKSLDF